ncbi:hypothetical protein RSSM_01613 [Rhodopirellula sallentina SM41]|uniref:Uncharacterized protein n=1 Tax=Rhodopirellula sallentina SM41 TaxID=1263870 RepID=M5U637_9BACT|nr:hypothetical protein RSSM_01613 [Rhodopirellula sallentina SM41]
MWYGWSSGDDWQARNQPRFWFADSLFKIQIAGPAETDSYRPVQEFVTEILPHTHTLISN